MPLPATYTPGHYAPVKVEGGYQVRRPGGSLLPGEPTSRGTATATATNLNDIRRRLAPGKGA